MRLASIMSCCASSVSTAASLLGLGSLKLRLVCGRVCALRAVVCGRCGLCAVWWVCGVGGLVSIRDDSGLRGLQGRLWVGVCGSAQCGFFGGDDGDEARGVGGEQGRLMR